ncbi:hypothetical protein ACET3Z_026215 [Daucus carota]
MDAVKKAKKKDCTAIEKSNVWKWIKKQKIFACRYVFVPICQRFVYQMYKNESVQGTDDVFQFDLSIPMVPQQDDGEKCGYYVLYYMFKFLMSCPENFNINEHGGFMNSSWFTEEEMNNFFNNLSSEKLHTDQMQASEDIIVVKEKIDGQNVDNEIAAEEIDKLSKDEEEAEMVVQCEPIRSLVVYTPESSQEQQEPNQPTPPASENEDEEVEEEEEKDDDEKPKKILIRAYPSTFSKTISRLSEAQRQWYFYLARTSHPDVRVKKTWPAFVGWKNSCIDDRAKREGLDNNFGYGDIGGNSNFTTPKETLKGVGPSRLFSPQDNVDASILSIARDVEQNHNSTEVLTEDEISSRLQHHLSQMEKLKKEFGETLDKGKQLFPESDKMKEYEQRFEEMTTGRAFNKMHDIDDFLDDLKLGGQVVDSNIYTKHITRNEPSYAAYGLNNHLKRVLKPTDHQKSPFKIRVIDLNTQRFSKDEEEVWSWINGRKNRAMIEIFLWNNVTCLKHHIQSLQIGKEVLFHVVDAYTSILNEDEKFRAAESPYRFFCSTMVTMGNVVKGSQLVANSTDPNITYMKFKSNMDAILFKHGVDINHVDLIFFPIFSGNHFYLICFNLRKICVDIIDNRSGDRVDIMYDGIPEALQENFGLYMAQKSPRKIKFLNNAPVERLEMKWRTSNKNVDSGVFVMHHMETYMGYTLRNWDCKFAAEGIEQKRQLEKARKIYAAKIVYSEINILKDHMKTEIKFVNQN